MTIKSLLIASAAALATVSAAQAADAVVAAEPEPVEYVRVCDAYGAGFFYIPGTETCLQISGYVWYQIGATNDDGTITPNYMGFTSGGWNKNVEARVNFDARNETEWGTLRSYIRLQADWFAGGDAPVGLDQAWFSLGGLRMGYTESAFVDTMVGGNSSWGSHTWGGLYYGYQQRGVIQYNFTGGNGVFGVISLEHDDAGNYIPDVVGVAGVNQGWGGAWVKAAYDESAAGFAASAGLHVNVPNAQGSSFRLIGFYANNANAYSVGGQWSILASYYHQFTPEFGASVGAQYIANTDFAVPGTPNLWAAELGVVWTPVTNFEVRAEAVYAKATGLDGSIEGFLRFTRYF